MIITASPSVSSPTVARMLWMNCVYGIATSNSLMSSISDTKICVNFLYASIGHWYESDQCVGRISWACYLLVLDWFIKMAEIGFFKRHSVNLLFAEFCMRTYFFIGYKHYTELWKRSKISIRASFIKHGATPQNSHLMCYYRVNWFHFVFPTALK